MAASTTRRRVQLGYELQDVNWGWSSSGQLRIFPYSVQMRENTDQKISEYGHFSRSAYEHIRLLSAISLTNSVFSKLPDSTIKKYC